MKEIFGMWKHTKMVVLVALSAGLYAAVLIPFKGLVLIPGITEIRPANTLPPVLGLLFGPAGAWGSAFGNLIGDFFGTLGVGSIFGFIGNFMQAYIPYKIWRNLGMLRSDDLEPNLNSGRKVFAYIVAALLGAFACALTIGWGLDLLKMVPFAALASIIAVNNSIPSIVLGIPLLLILYPRVKKWNLLWTDIMDEEEISKPDGKTRIAAIIMTLAIIVGLFGGLVVAVAGGQSLFAAGFAGGGAGSVTVGLVAGLSTIIFILAGLL
ncbi:MAG TPA: QueT transporter family protein [Clostridia bacterium]|nr:QueT transporter family protein [Clostridia bacterium]